MAGNGVRKLGELSQKWNVTARVFQKGKNHLGGSELATSAGIQAEAGGPVRRGLAMVGTCALEGRELRDP